VVPALAVADALRAEGAHVEFVGAGRAEAELVPAAGYPLHTLPLRGLDRSNPLRAVHATVRAVVPRMDIDREVAAQIAAVDTLLPEICRAAAEAVPSLA